MIDRDEMVERLRLAEILLATSMNPDVPGLAGAVNVTRGLAEVRAVLALLDAAPGPATDQEREGT